MRVRAATYNTHHGAGPDGVLDLAATLRAIRSCEADLVGLQEVDRHWGSRSAYLNQARWLGERLGMHAVFGANVEDGAVRAGEARPQYGTAMLSRWPVVDWRNVLLPRFEGGEQRGLLEATIRAGSRRIRFACTHLQHDDPAERQGQAKAIVDLLGGREVPTVLVGDLNAVPGSVEIESLTRLLRDTWAEVGIGSGSTHPSERPARRIDYVLASREWSLARASVIAGDASDHLPYVVEMEIGDPAE